MRGGALDWPHEPPQRHRGHRRAARRASRPGRRAPVSVRLDGEATAASDVDIFVDLKRGVRFSLFDLMDLRDDLGKLLRARADVFLRQSLHRAIRRDIEAEAIRVF